MTPDLKIPDRIPQWETADLLVWRISPFSAAMRRTSLARAW